MHLLDQIDRCRIISGRDIDDICLAKMGWAYWLIWTFESLLQPVPFKYRVMAMHIHIGLERERNGKLRVRATNNA